MTENKSKFHLPVFSSSSPPSIPVSYPLQEPHTHSHQAYRAFSPKNKVSKIKCTHDDDQDDDDVNKTYIPAQFLVLHMHASLQDVRAQAFSTVSHESSCYYAGKSRRNPLDYSA